MSTSKGDALTHFDFLRGIAAVAVAVGHVRGPFFVDYDMLASPGVAMKVLYLLTGLGHQAVVLFFVLSGFFVGSSVLSTRDDWSWSRYLLRRFTRLWVVLVPALLATLIIDRVGMASFGVEGVYGGHVDAPQLVFDRVVSSGRPAIFFSNLFFLQGIFTQTFGTNGPLWSLSYEFWAYMLFPLLVQAAARGVGVGRRGLYVALAIGILVLGGERLRFYFSIWVMGAVIAGVWPRVRFPAKAFFLARAATWIVFLVTLVATRTRLLGSQDRGDVALGVSTGVLVLVLSVTDQRQGTGALARAYQRVAKHLAGFSYTLYLVHFPALMFVHAAVIHGPRWPADVRHLSVGAALCVAVIWLFAFPLARLTEAHTERVRKWMGGLLGVAEKARTVPVRSAETAPPG